MSISRWLRSLFGMPDYARYLEHQARCHVGAPVLTEKEFVLAEFERKYAGDFTNWWIPNRACLEGMLRSAGFEITGHPEREVFICRPLDRLPHEEMPWWKR